MKNFIRIIYPLLFLSFTGFPLAHAESVIDNPSERVIHFPLKKGPDGRWRLKNPLDKKPLPLRVIAHCELERESLFIVKENRKKKAFILSGPDRQQKTIKNVTTSKLSKDMLGQYSAAIVIAQKLGLTEVDSIKIYSMSGGENRIRPRLQKGPQLIFFLDNDDEVVDRTYLEGQNWIRCLNLDTHTIPFEYGSGGQIPESGSLSIENSGDSFTESFEGPSSEASHEPDIDERTKDSVEP